jgi:hypothetical protein
VGEKGVELKKGEPGGPKRKKRKYKARLVAGGHNVRGTRGERISENLSHIIPASLTAVRIGEVHAAGYSDGVSLNGDVKLAYVKAVLEGDDMWASLPKQVRPSSHANFSDPVVQIKKALYGLKRSGLDWGMKVRRQLLQDNWSFVRDVGESSIYWKGPVLLLVFTDDFKFNGPLFESYKEFHAIDRVFGFSSSSKEDPEGSNFIGIERLRLQAPRGCTKVKLHQADYISHAVEKLEKRIKKPLREWSTPAKTKVDPRDHENSAIRGELYEDAPEFIGIARWIVRFSRPDATFTVAVLSRRLRTWSVEDDEMLIRLFGYLKKTKTLGITLFISHSEFQSMKLWIATLADSDHAGLPDDAKSTSGWLCFVRGVRSLALVDWNAKKQGSTAYSTPDAEATAQTDAVVRSSAPIWIMLSQVWGYELAEKLYCDNSAARVAIVTGVSRKLCYLRRTQRVSLGLMSDYVSDDNASMSAIDTRYNGSDLLTKSLDEPNHYRLMDLIGME